MECLTDFLDVNITKLMLLARVFSYVTERANQDTHLYTHRFKHHYCLPLATLSTALYVYKLQFLDFSWTKIVYKTSAYKPKLHPSGLAKYTVVEIMINKKFPWCLCTL